MGDDVVVVVVDIRGDKVRLGIDAPANLPVHRSEVYDAIQQKSGVVVSHAGSDHVDREAVDVVGALQDAVQLIEHLGGNPKLQVEALRYVRGIQREAGERSDRHPVHAGPLPGRTFARSSE